MRDHDAEKDAEHTARAMAVWPMLREQAGLPPEGWTSELVHRRNIGEVFRTVLRLQNGPRSVILKHEADPRRRDRFAEEIDAHRAAAKAFGTDLVLRVPQVIAARSDLGAILVEHVPDRLALHAMTRSSLAQQLDLLERIGAWLHRFHFCRETDTRISQSRSNLKHLSSILADLEAGRQTVHEPEEFRKYASICIATADDFSGQLTIGAHLHGDFHLRNVFAERSVWAIDFLPGHYAPVGHDIARLLVHWATLFADEETIPDGRVLPDKAEEAFFRGYKGIRPGDPSVAFLMRLRIFADWWRLTHGRDELGLDGALRLDGLRALARRAFQ